jgi:hypothetical protein
VRLDRFVRPFFWAEVGDQVGVVVYRARREVKPLQNGIVGVKERRWDEFQAGSDVDVVQRC